MATTTAQTTDVAGVLAGLLEAVDDLRVYPHIPDNARVPCAVVFQPTINFEDQTAGFCSATWVFPIHLVVARSNERKAQADLSRLILDVVSALKVDVPEVFSIEPMDAIPVTVTVNGQDLPGYRLQVRVRA